MICPTADDWIWIRCFWNNWRFAIHSYQLLFRKMIVHNIHNCINVSIEPTRAAFCEKVCWRCGQLKDFFGNFRRWTGCDPFAFIAVQDTGIPHWFTPRHSRHHRMNWNSETWNNIKKGSPPVKGKSEPDVENLLRGLVSILLPPTVARTTVFNLGFSLSPRNLVQRRLINSNVDSSAIINAESTESPRRIIAMKIASQNWHSLEFKLC